MADTDTSREDRQLEPSERRLQKAREEGQVAHSRDATHAAVLGVALLGLAGYGATLGNEALALVRQGLRFSRPVAIDAQLLTQWFDALVTAALWIVVPPCAALALAAAAGAMVPGGAVMTLKPLMPNFAKLNPATGLSRMFSRDNAVDLAKLALLAVVLGGLSVWFAAGRFEQFAALGHMSLQQALEITHGGLVAGLGVLVGLLFVWALADVPLQWFRHRRQFKMTFQEAREEARETEGDPAVKARQRVLQREIASRRMLAAVPSADVVVTNPTHYAVAIRYDDTSMHAPRVVAKGADLVAAKIREIATEAGVPMFEAPPLARALWRHVDLDEEIPATLYTAVAQVLAYIYQLRRFVPGRGRHPSAPDAIPVPPGMDPQESA